MYTINHRINIILTYCYKSKTNLTDAGTPLQHFGQRALLGSWPFLRNCLAEQSLMFSKRIRSVKRSLLFFKSAILVIQKIISKVFFLSVLSIKTHLA